MIHFFERPRKVQPTANAGLSDTPGLAIAYIDTGMPEPMVLVEIVVDGAIAQTTASLRNIRFLEPITEQDHPLDVRPSKRAGRPFVVGGQPPRAHKPSGAFVLTRGEPEVISPDIVGHYEIASPSPEQMRQALHREETGC